MTDDAPSGTRSRNPLHRLGWVGPLLAAVVAVGICAFVYLSVQRSLRHRVAEDLTALADSLAVSVPRGDLADPANAKTLADLVAAATPGDTGEALVFDENGTLLVATRADAALRAAGVFPATLGLDLRDPGGDLSSGFRPDRARKSLPLTVMAGSATSGRDGIDVEGYRSYRGSAVVGAWRWLPDAKRGVAVEMEAAEAFGPARVLLTAFLVLGGIAIAAGVAGALVARRNAALLRKMREAESKARTLGQYTLLKRIGEGGMGEVYLARHAMLRRPTAVKLLRADSTSPQAVARFEREVQQTTRLTHPNTVQIYDFGRTPGGTFYYAMEYLVGVSLDRWVADVGPFDEGRAIYILLQVCASLNEAHELGLVHRDIKPENISLCRAAGAFDVAKVLDFGLVMDRASDEAVKLSATGALLGTPKYMPPEAFIRPESVDARSDIYSLGAVAYFMLTGRPPFEGKTVVDLFHAHTKEKPLPPSEVTDRPIRPDLDNAILACLEKDPARRPASANALARELEWCAAAEDWNRDKARYWWIENEKRLEKLYGLSSKAQMDPMGGTQTMEIRLEGR